jgi:hypothetical protein
MYKSFRSRLTAVASVVALSMAFAAPAQAQNQAGDSLVNVQIGDLDVLVPVGVAANLCDVNANVLSEQGRQGRAECTADATSTASPGQRRRRKPGGSLARQRPDRRHDGGDPGRRRSQHLRRERERPRQAGPRRWRVVRGHEQRRGLVASGGA